MVTCQTGILTTNESMDDVHTRCGEEVQQVRFQLRLQNEGRDDVQTIGGEGR